MNPAEIGVPLGNRNINPCSLLHVIRNNLEIFIYGPAIWWDDPWNGVDRHIKQIECMENLLKDVDLSSGRGLGDDRMRLRLTFDSKGTARLHWEDFGLFLVPLVSGVSTIQEHRLHSVRWQPGLQTKWGLLDGKTEVEVVYAWDFDSSEKLFFAVEAVKRLMPLDLVAPLTGCLVDEEDRMIGLVFEVEPGERQLGASDAHLILDAFAALETDQIYMFIPESEEEYWEGFFPWILFNPEGVVVANDKIRFVNNMLFSWSHVIDFGTNTLPAAVLADAKRSHWKVAQKVVQSGIGNDNDVWPHVKFDLSFYETLTVIFPPEYPLDDVLATMLGKTMRSYERASAGKRRQRIASAKGQRPEKEQDHIITSPKKKIRAQGFAPWSGPPVGAHSKLWVDRKSVEKAGPPFPTRGAQPRFKAGSTGWPLRQAAWTDTKDDPEGCHAWIEEVTNELSSEAGVSGAKKRSGLETSTGEA